MPVVPETDTQQNNSAPSDAAELGPPMLSEEARARADGFRRRADAPPASGPGLLPDVFEELNATIEELRVAEEEMRVQNEELLRTRQRVEAERHRYQDLFEFAPDGYLVTTLDGKILEANRAASTLLGIAPRFLKGRGLGTSVAPEDLPVYSAALRALAASPAPLQEMALRLRRRHAGPFHAAVTAAPVAAGAGQPATLRWLVRDITERRQAEEERAGRGADALQRLLLHAADAFPRLSVETFCRAAPDGAGGEGVFFDAFALDGGRVALVSGDSGVGPDAAARAAEIKYALRVLLRQEPGPALALARLSGFGLIRPTALALAVVDTGTGETVSATADGASLLVLRAGGGAEVLDAEAQAALGMGDALLLSGGLLDAPAELAEAARGAGTLRSMGQALLAAARTDGTSGDAARLLLARRRE